MSKEDDHIPPLPEHAVDQDVPKSRFNNVCARGIDEYLTQSGNEVSGVLRPYQSEVFESIANFFEAGHTRGYIDLPTGTGKTVLFVELSKALLTADTETGQHPKILVVTPTKDLVLQTIGRSGEKGFGKFAPDIRVTSYFSDTSENERSEAGKSDVTVTTYASFKRMQQRPQYKPVEDFDQDVLNTDTYRKSAVAFGEELARDAVKGIRNVPTGKTFLDNFDVLILDEAHHTMGKNMQEILGKLPKNKIVIGFTATPFASEEKQLQDHLPVKIHTLQLNEAIHMGLLAPTIPVGIQSNTEAKGYNLYDDSGDFIDARIQYLAENPQRNALVVNAAKEFASHNIGTIISCIAGGEVWHAQHIAELLQGEGVRATAIHGGISSRQRSALYRKFESGQIDVLTYVGVLGEGWDSQRAKALINARPTRSPILAKQRLGRITRPGNIAFAVDILDIYDEQNPVITVADILDEGSIAFGYAVGDINRDDPKLEILSSLQSSLPVLPSLHDDFNHNMEIVSQLPKLDKGRMVLYEDFTPRKFALLSMIQPYSGITEDVISQIEQISGETVASLPAAQGTIARTVYDVEQVKKILSQQPKVDPKKYYVDEQKTKWISPQGLVTLFSQRYPRLNTLRMEKLLEDIGDTLPWIPGIHQTTPDNAYYKHFKVLRLYRADQSYINILDKIISKQLSDIFTE